MDELTIDDARAILDAQPFSRHLGATIAEFRHGYCVLELPALPHLGQQHGFVHGGVIAYAADNVAAFAAGSVLGPMVLTSSVAIEYLRPLTGALRAEARVVQHDDRQAECHCQVMDDGGTVCATAVAQVRVSSRARPGSPT